MSNLLDNLLRKGWAKNYNRWRKRLGQKLQPGLIMRTHTQPFGKRLDQNTNRNNCAYAYTTLQVIFDFAFYMFFTSVPSGANHMLDFFKGYAKDVKEGAIIGDSVLVIFAVVLSAFLNLQSFDVNIVILIISIYLIPYFIFMKD